MSELDRRTGLKHLRIRGHPAVRLCAKLKAAGVNIYRAARVLAVTLAKRRADGRKMRPRRLPAPVLSTVRVFAGAIQARISIFVRRGIDFFNQLHAEHVERRCPQGVAA
jgi:hypothetical protein